MVAAIVGCGGTANLWWRECPIDAMSYGVNDAFKWGMGLQNLIVVNGPHKFSDERLAHIISTPAKNFFTHLVHPWKSVSKHNIIPIRLSPFLGQIMKSHDILLHTNTSPFIAMCMAFNDGHEDIRLFGVDFNDHGTFKYGERKGNHEIAQYAQFAELVAKEGVKIRVTKESALSKFIDTF